MDPKVYLAAKEGTINVLEQYMHKLDDELTPNKNTVLHVAVQFDEGSTRVKQILEMGPSLLFRVNSKGETPLHIAAREGRKNAVKDLIECAKIQGKELESGAKVAIEMLRKTNEDGDTALHVAIRSGLDDCRLDVVKMLIQEDPESSHPANNACETPLYLAADREHCDIVGEIVRTCTSPSYGGPEDRTALHAAVIRNSEGSYEYQSHFKCSIRNSEECVKFLYNWKQSLTKEADKNGWTPLHYAADFGYALMFKKLLGLDKYVAYITADKDEKNTALHIAASRGYEGIMKELLFSCPDCWEMINGRGQNILHIAIENEELNVIQFIMGNPWYSNLINQKDADENTPLHLFAASNNSHMLDLIKLTPRADLKAFNKKNLTPLDITVDSDQHTREKWRIRHFFIYGEPMVDKTSIKEQFRSAGAIYGWRNTVNKHRKKAPVGKKEEIQKDIRKIADTHLIVAVLIATVTFAAGFTMPGGYANDNSNEGMAILTRKTVFQIFVISNTIAMISSTCAVFLHFIASGYTDKDKVLNRFGYAIYFIITAMVAMVIAFITGMYAVLAQSSALLISICIVGCLSFLLYFFLLGKAWRDF